MDCILGEFDEIYWNSRRGCKNIQLNYATSVRPAMPIKLNPDEHSGYLVMGAGGANRHALHDPWNEEGSKDAFVFAKKYISL